MELSESMREQEDFFEDAREIEFTHGHWSSNVEGLEAKVRKLDAVGKYGRHNQQCPVSLAWGKGPGGTGIECDCGFEKALADLGDGDA